MIKVANVIRSVHNVETCEDDQDKGGDDGDDTDDDVDDGHDPGLGRLVPSRQACDSLDKVHSSGPVSLSVRDLISAKR